MKEKTISCYLCGEEAIEMTNYEEGKVTRNSIIECSGECKPYETTDGSRKFYLDREDHKSLTNEAKKTLITYLEKHYRDQPIRLTTELIKNLVGNGLE